MSSPVVLRWTPEFHELVDAFEARRYALGFRRRAWLVAWLCLVVAVVLMLYTLLIPAMVLVLGGLVVAMPATGRVLARRTLLGRWRADPSLAAPAEASVSGTGLTRRTQDDETSWEWSAFPVWIETPELFVLSQSAQRYGAFITLPKRGAEDSEDLAAVRDLMLAGMGVGLRWPRSDRWDE
ncbi:MAG TPA: YcxB family protein [Nocardioides sp.]|uniref:YcxB family protein n=1 Tax=Nocardioides sp. TaxID=35761 RepID=UPI002E3360D5|nr:YcxB family protein [Nocardioides sp.]HEX5088656.1 YcxB family protein [Nocardioides sp.]